MAHTDGYGQNPVRVEQIILDGLHSFFANPRHFDQVVFAVRKSRAQLAAKLEKITDELVAIDRQTEALEQSTSRVLARISRQIMDESVGAAILTSAQQRLQQLSRRRATLEVHETWLGKEITAIEAFRREHPWCRLYWPGQRRQAKTDLPQAFVDSVVVYLRFEPDAASEAGSK